MSLYRSILRVGINLKNRCRLKNRDLSIISSNCVGGIICHELKLRFNSPTVNLFFVPDDYLKFLKNMKYYLSCELVECNSDKEYPVGSLDDINIYFMHYDSFEIAKQKWEERSKRINYENLYVIMVQRDGCNDEHVRAFNKLEYKNKVILTAKDYAEIPNAYNMSPYVNENGEVIDLCKYISKLSGKRYIDYFDYVDFLNRK